MVITLLDSLGFCPFVVAHWIIALSITLLVLDIFFQTEFISWIAIICFSSYLSILSDHRFNVPFQWSVLIFIIFLSINFFLYYACWRKFLNPLIASIFMKNATPEIDERVVGQIAVFRIIDRNYFAEWNGELWAVDSARDLNEFTDGMKVKILEKKEGKIII